jgi:hypothetical protein
MKKLYIFFTLSLISTNAFNCSCDYIGNFLWVAPGSDLVAVVRLMEHDDYFDLTGALPEPSSVYKTPLSGRFEVLDVLKGDETRSEIKVFGDIGNLCRPYMSQFEVGKYYLIALYKIENDYTHDDHNITETTDDYQIIICGEFWLEYDQATKSVTGRVIHKKKKSKIYSIEEIREQLI